MERIQESELILNSRGAIYHLDLRPEEIAHNIITVGDPQRVQEVSKHFDSIELKRHHREFVTHTGYIGRKRFSVLSTGIGTDNIDIVFNELDALVNIDFISRSIKTDLTSLNIVRIGTSGALQKDIPVDSFLVSTHGIGVDNLLNFYDFEPSHFDKELLNSFIKQTSLGDAVAKPYVNPSSQALLERFQDGFHHGITVTCPGFYGPQGRVLRLGLRHPKFIDQLSEFEFRGNRITNFEMETAGIYGMAKLLGHQALSINAIIANRIGGIFSKNPQNAIESLIEKTMSILVS
ncbi:MAG: nucleoside phosphorylase [Sphingobacteriales bacterium]|nr:nucleoside phosphorylase [Sphingobacteriales bacterium]